MEDWEKDTDPKARDRRKSKQKKIENIWTYKTALGYISRSATEIQRRGHAHSLPAMTRLQSWADLKAAGWTAIRSQGLIFITCNNQRMPNHIL